MYYFRPCRPHITTEYKERLQKKLARVRKGIVAKGIACSIKVPSMSSFHDDWAFWASTASRTAIRAKRIKRIVPQAIRGSTLACSRYTGMRQMGYLHCPPSDCGIVTTRTVLSTLPETRRVEVGLKRTAVGGKSCAFKIVKSGYEICELKNRHMHGKSIALTLREVASNTPMV